MLSQLIGGLLQHLARMFVVSAVREFAGAASGFSSSQDEDLVGDFVVCFRRGSLVGAHKIHSHWDREFMGGDLFADPYVPNDDFGDSLWAKRRESGYAESEKHAASLLAEEVAELNLDTA